jgi:hypothetical protein
LIVTNRKKKASLFLAGFLFLLTIRGSFAFVVYQQPAYHVAPITESPSPASRELSVCGADLFSADSARERATALIVAADEADRLR